MASSSPPPAQAPVLSPPNPPRPQQHPQPLPVAAVKSEVPVAEPRDPPASVSSIPLEPSPAAVAASYTITIPSCSGWFSWDQIHDTERRVLSEFFDGKSASKNPGVYKYYRDSIIRRFRGNPSRKITFTDARRGLVGDVGSIRRVFDFLEEWGLINYTPSAKPSAKKGEMGDDSEKKETPRRICSHCKSSCNMACFTTDKADIILCARCFVRGDYRPGLSSTDFKRVDITEETKADWTDKETIHLLEAILQYGDDWKKVAEHVGTKSEIDCVARFIKLPFGEQFLGPEEVGEYGKPHQKNDKVVTVPEGENVPEQSLSKRMRLTPLADASNPIMAQVAFLSAMVGSDVAKAVAQAAISSLHKVDITGGISASDDRLQSAASNGAKEEGYRIKLSSYVEAVAASNGQTSSDVLNEAVAQAQSQLKKEEQDVEQYLSDVVQVQMKEIQDKIVHFEELELLLEKERLQLRHMKDLLFADQLAIMQHKMQLLSKGNEKGEKVKQTNHVP
ncbi:SWI/SNF complex subunit SWI3B-like isoform X1 [Musa acuminata AAA Group]|uniref:SWI/SNF complex subunit SWI3B-like isoform X1 n=1 Tax=Musa acuminata AAA Group TaxID=214697 RepID=UPI0031E28FA9